MCLYEQNYYHFMPYLAKDVIALTEEVKSFYLESMRVEISTSQAVRAMYASWKNDANRFELPKGDEKQ